MSFTIEILRSKMRPVSLLKLINHWVDTASNFALQSVVLQGNKYHGLPTNQINYLNNRKHADKVENDKSNFHVVIQDAGAVLLD